MRISIVSTLILALAVACHSTKKSTTTTTPVVKTETVTGSTVATNPPAKAVKSSDGIYEPGNEELTAIQLKYKDVTLEKLKQGHYIYTEGVCINCHSPKNIYKRPEAEWKNIIDDMAARAMLSETYKDAVYKYVLSVKAVQQK